jgi:hypothetical protein
MDRRSFFLGATGFATAAFAANEAEAAPLVFLGRRKVDILADHDVIHVGASQGFFKKIQFHVSGNDVFLYDVDVRYANGGRDDITTRFKVPQGGFSRKIDLRFNNRKIQSVSFFYGKLPNGRGATHIELFGWR